MHFERKRHLNNLKTSAFLFGPRMTGKTTLARGIKAALRVDLLDPVKELELRQTPQVFWEWLTALPKKSVVVVDEIQRVPSLLDYVQKGIEELNLTFLMSGSSARKLKRGGANLLGGRAVDLKLHPLTCEEMGLHFQIEHALQFGTLPKIAQLTLEKSFEEARDLLRSYYTTYIKEEIQAEAITRNVGAFQRFLSVAAQANGQVIEFANISRECAVPMSTVKEYFSILEDTLLGEFLWPWDRSERKKARPKFYFFDCGVVRSIQNRLQDPPTPLEKGFLFETWFIRELIRHRDYRKKPHEFSFWRQGDHEIDLVVSGGRGPLLAMEIKLGTDPPNQKTIELFRRQFSKTPVVVASLGTHTTRRLESGLDIFPWKKALDVYLNL